MDRRKCIELDNEPQRQRTWQCFRVKKARRVGFDGQPVGITPLKSPIDNLKPGQHVIAVKRAGYMPCRQSITIKLFEPTRLTVTLE